MKLEMIRLLPMYQGVDSKNPYSFMRDFEDVCSAFLSIRIAPLYNLYGVIPILFEGKGQNMVSLACSQFNFYLGRHAK